MKKKYTMEQFEEIFDEAVIKALDKLDKELREQLKDEEVDGMRMFAFLMQNTIAMAELKKVLFKESE